MPARFRAYGWSTLTIKDGDKDLNEIARVLQEARDLSANGPVLVSIKTTIGFGSKKAGTDGVHGSPLGADDIKHVKSTLGFNPDESFHVPQQVYDAWKQHSAHAAEYENKWNQIWAQYQEKYPAEAAVVKQRMSTDLPADWRSKLPSYNPSMKADATRNLSGVVLNALADSVVSLVGGSADLTPSNKTDLKKSHDVKPGDFGGRYIRFGVREHGMAAIGNGMFAFGGFIPYTATFLNFLSYCFPAARLAALSEFQQLFIMTHDSIGLGEDGPTHQPVEILSLCRATPNLFVFRPADGNETVGSYVQALERKNAPSVLSLTRQNLPQLAHSSVDGVAKGAYVLEDGGDKPDIILIGSGSETPIAVDAAKLLNGLKVRVVSMPCTTLFDRQTTEYRRSVLPLGIPIVSVEAASIMGWERYSHYAIGMTTFGASAPYEKLYEKFGFTPENVANISRKVVEAYKSMPVGQVPTQLDFDFRPTDQKSHF